MKLTPKVMKKIEKFALSKVKNNDILHRKEHIYRVVRVCKVLAKKEKANFKICKAAALLHDIDRKKRGDHALKGSKTAEKFLKKLKVDEDIIEQICYTIYRHNKGLPNKTIESRVLHDADNLEAVGAYGFLRHFVWAIDTKKLSFDLAVKDAIREHKKFSKWIHTKTAKKISKEKMKQTKDFLKYL